MKQLGSCATLAHFRLKLRKAGRFKPATGAIGAGCYPSGEPPPIAYPTPALPAYSVSLYSQRPATAKTPHTGAVGVPLQLPLSDPSNVGKRR